MVHQHANVVPFEIVSRELMQMQGDYNQLSQEHRNVIRGELRQLVQTVPAVSMAQGASSASAFKQLAQMDDAGFDRAFFSKELAQAAVDTEGFFDKLKKIASKAKGFIDKGIAGVNNAAGKINSVGGQIADTVNGVTGAGTNLLGSLTDQTKNIGDAAGGLMTGLTGGAEALVNQGADTVGGLKDSASTSMDSISNIGNVLGGLFVQEQGQVGQFGQSPLGLAPDHNGQPLDETISLLTMKDMNALYNVYKAADSNGNGFITKDEIARAFGLHPADQEKINLMLKTIDSDNSGFIDFAEFVNWGSQPESEVLQAVEESDGVSAGDLLTPGQALPPMQERQRNMQNGGFDGQFGPNQQNPF